MTLDAEDKIWLTQLVRNTLSTTAAPALLPRLTVQQFAVAVELSEEVVRRKIRVRMIPPAMVTDRPYKISPKALELFRVTQPEAHARLEAHNLLPTLQRSQG